LEQLALSRRSRFCVLQMSFFPCQVSLSIPQRELERGGIERGKSRALLDLITDVHIARNDPAEHLKAQASTVPANAAPSAASGATMMLSTGRIGGAGAVACL
jgi:hypothetical protein